MYQQLVKFVKEEDGATAIEYGLIVGLIAVVVAGVLVTTGTDLGNIFTSVNDSLKSATSSGG